jgi:hypothetical protein|tara:strand:- start:3230 stop:4300 length:1071 start_codon:yes stop_codon:yes gene_type:complete
MIYLTLITALSIAGVAAWYSILGLIAIFSGAVVPIAIMGGVLEVGKLVTATWLHQNWKRAPILMKTYLTASVLMLMVVTSLGIFGFLSKAHLETSISSGGNNSLRIENLERQIDNEQRKIDDAVLVIGQLDGQVQTLIDYDRVRGKEGAMAVRKGQSEERESLNNEINNSYANIEKFQDTLLPIRQSQLELEVEVGPLKYIAELIYGDNAVDHFDEAVRWVIILLIITFDPLAIVLLLAASMGFRDKKLSKVFYEDGNMKVSPDNVVSMDTDYEVQPREKQYPPTFVEMKQTVAEEMPDVEYFEDQLVEEIPDIPEDDYETISDEDGEDSQYELTPKGPTQEKNMYNKNKAVDDGS